MNYIAWRQLFLLIAGIPIAAWCMFVAMRFLVYTFVREFIFVNYHNWNLTNQVVWCIVELGIIFTFDELRNYTVKEAIHGLQARFQKWYHYIAVYATLTWLVSMGSLLWILWHIPSFYNLAIIIQLLLLSFGIGTMMGIAVPYSAGRSWLYLRKKWKEKKNGPF